MVRTITFSEDELTSGAISEDTLKEAVEIYTEDGCLLLNNVLSKDYVKTLHTSYIKKYSPYFKDKKFQNALRVGDQRFMVTIKMETPFNSQKVYANPLVYPIIENLLGDECIINGFGSVVSLPDAPDQNTHYDHPALFKEDKESSSKIPSSAITVITPLVELNEKTGTTVMMPKSHRYPQNVNADYGLTYDFPTAPLGSVILMDYRLRHYGMANRSGELRPILYNIYSRPWFRDYRNYKKQSALEVSKKDYKKIPDKLKHLFLFAEQI